ncbi:hypothetical protein U1Q18_043180 [Sarracenia purpurea var. burkii]
MVLVLRLWDLIAAAYFSSLIKVVAASFAGSREPGTKTAGICGRLRLLLLVFVADYAAGIFGRLGNL